MKLFFLIVWLPFLSNLAHPYYVSIWDILVNTETKTVQITTKVMIDDLELGLRKLQATSAKINWNSSHKDSSRYVDSLLTVYFNLRNEVLLDGKVIPLNYLGREVELDVVFIYFESKLWTDEPKHFRLVSQFLTNEIPDQTNIIHLVYKSTKKSFLLNKAETSVDYNLIPSN